MVEVKTFWALNLPDDLVSAIEKSGGEGKIAHAVQQVYGYMSVNHLKYGVLSTYEKTFFFRRVVVSEGQQQSILEVSGVVERDRTRKDGFTAMEAWMAFILLTDRDSFYSSPNSTPEMKSKFILPAAESVDMKMFFKLSDFYFSQRISGGQLGAVVG